MRQKSSFLAEAFLENTNNTDLYSLLGTLMRAHSTEMHEQMLKNDDTFYALPCNHAFKRWGFTSIHSEG